MFALDFLVFTAFICCCSAYNIDTRTSKVRIWQGTKTGSYFGFSVALHGRVTKKNIILVGAPLDSKYPEQKIEGDVYVCDIDKKGRDCHADILQDVKAAGELTKQMFGASIFTSGRDKDVIVCAPRYTQKSESKYKVIGKCVMFNENLRKANDDAVLRPCDSSISTYEYCQAGFDVKYYTTSKHTYTIMGAVGTKTGSGALVLQSSSNKGSFVFTPFDQTIKSDYLGYSVAHGNFFSNDTDKQELVAGQPRGGSSGSTELQYFTGKVIIYKYSDGDSTFAVVRTVQPPRNVLKNNGFIYFGLSVCAVDINRDGYSDLLVGAPFYSDTKGDEGRVYVYLSQPNFGGRTLKLASGENDLDPGLRGRNQAGARFGWTIVAAGDLNDDGYQDVIIGAPHDGPDLDGDGLGNGAIYIYHGQLDGKMQDYQQVITAKVINEKFGVILKQFGYAVSGNMDTDDNDYPDIAVGAWQSDAVVLLRTRPVMDLDVSLVLTKKEIPVEADSNATNCKDGGSDRQCLNVTACFKYQGKSVTGEHELDYTFILDRTTGQSAAKRVYLRNDKNEKIYQIEGTLKLKKKAEEFCKKFSNIFVENKNHLQNSLAPGIDIVFEVKYSLISKPECLTTDLCPILDKRQKPIIQEKATLILNCSDNTCDYDLFVKLRPDPINITIGKTLKVIVEVTLGNREEKVYNPEIKVDHDASLQYEKFEVLNKNVKIERRSLNIGNVSITEKFRLRGLLDSGEKVVIRLQYSSRNVKDTNDKLAVRVNAEASSGKESNVTDNKATVYFAVQREVQLIIDTRSVPKAITYPVAETVVGTPGVNKTDYRNVNASLIGPLVKTTFLLTNLGKSDLQKVMFSITYPYRENGENNQQKYIVYPVFLDYPVGNGGCGKAQLNPESLKNIKKEQAQSREKRATIKLTSRSRESATISCTVNELQASTGRFTVELWIRVWENTMVQYHPNDIILTFSASASYYDPLTKLTTRVGPKPLDIRASAENRAAKKKTTPVWVIIVAVLGGVLLLAIAIFALFKFGFFKRNRPPKDISSPESNDTAPVI